MIDLAKEADWDDDNIILLNKMVEDFVSSEKANFMDYFLWKESEFLQKVEWDDTDFAEKNETPCIIGGNGLYIQSVLGYGKPNRAHIDSVHEIDLNTRENRSEIEKWLFEQETIFKEGRERWLNQYIDFTVVYDLIMTLNQIYDKDVNDYCIRKEVDFPVIDYYYSHHAYSALCKFAEIFVESVLFPEWEENLTFVGSSRYEAKRAYFYGSKEGLYPSLEAYLDAKKEYYNYQASHSKKRYYEADSFMTKWVRRFELGHSVSIKRDEEATSIIVRLYKDEEDKQGVNLADEGTGVTQLLSILIPIETAILKKKGLKFHEFYGQTDIDGFDEDKFYEEQDTIIAEEPEIHLHPQFQSLLADMFVEALQYNVHFVVETHSEYLIRKLQYIVATSKYETQEDVDKECPFRVFYVAEKGRAYDMQFRPNGKFMQAFGEGFFDEADKWVMRMFELEEE